MLPDSLIYLIVGTLTRTGFNTTDSNATYIIARRFLFSCDPGTVISLERSLRRDLGEIDQCLDFVLLPDPAHEDGSVLACMVYRRPEKRTS